MVFTFIIFSILIVILVFYSMYNKGTIDLVMLNTYLIKIFGKKTVEFIQQNIVIPIYKFCLYLKNKLIDLYKQFYPIISGFIIQQAQFPAILIWGLIFVLIMIFYNIYPRMPHLGIFFKRINKKTLDAKLDMDINNRINQNNQYTKKVQKIIENSMLNDQDKQNIKNLQNKVLSGFDYSLIQQFFDIGNTYDKYQQIENNAVSYLVQPSQDGTQYVSQQTQFPRLSKDYYVDITTKMYDLYNHFLDFNQDNIVGYIPDDFLNYIYFISSMNPDTKQQNQLHQYIDQLNDRYKNNTQYVLKIKNIYSTFEIYKDLQTDPTQQILQLYDQSQQEKVLQVLQGQQEYQFKQPIEDYIQHINNTQFYLTDFDITNYQYNLLQNVNTKKQSSKIHDFVGNFFSNNQSVNIVLSLNKDWIQNIYTQTGQQKPLTDNELQNFLWGLIYQCIQHVQINIDSKNKTQISKSKQYLTALKKLLYSSFINDELLFTAIEKIRKIDEVIDNIMNKYIPYEMKQKYVDMFNTMCLVYLIDGDLVIDCIKDQYQNLNHIVNINILEEKAILMQYYDQEYYDQNLQRINLLNSMKNRFTKWSQNTSARLSFKDMNGIGQTINGARKFVGKLKQILTSQQFWFQGQNVDMSDLFSSLDFGINSLMSSLEPYDQQNKQWEILIDVVKYDEQNPDTNVFHAQTGNQVKNQYLTTDGQTSDTSNKLNINISNNDQSFNDKKNQLINLVKTTSEFTLDESKMLIDYINSQKYPILQQFENKIKSTIDLVNGTLSSQEVVKLVVNEMKIAKDKYQKSLIRYRSGDQVVTINLDDSINLLQTTTLQEIPKDQLTFQRDALKPIIDPFVFKGFNTLVKNLAGTGKIMQNNDDGGSSGFNIFQLLLMLFKLLLDLPKLVVQLIQIVFFIIQNVISKLESQGLIGAMQELLKGVLYAFFYILFNFPLVDSIIIGIVVILSYILRIFFSGIHLVIILAIVLLTGIYYLFAYILPTAPLFKTLNKYVMYAQVSCQEQPNQWYMQNFYEIQNKTDRVDGVCYQPCLNNFKPGGKFFCIRTQNQIEIPQFSNKSLIMQTYLENKQYSSSKMSFNQFYTSGAIPQLSTKQLRNLLYQNNNQLKLQNYIEDLLQQYKQLQQQYDIPYQDKNKVKLRDFLHDLQVRNVCKTSNDPDIQQLCKQEYCQQSFDQDFCHKFSIPNLQKSEQNNSTSYQLGNLEKFSIFIVVTYIFYINLPKFQIQFDNIQKK